MVSDPTPVGWIVGRRSALTGKSFRPHACGVDGHQFMRFTRAVGRITFQTPRLWGGFDCLAEQRRRSRFRPHAWGVDASKSKTKTKLTPFRPHACGVDPPTSPFRCV